ncbi:response regulator [Algoriphagus yeomjeoni]|uniref:CheY-like chemotaxis protein n=1 Tax=Algoriphagus yeomjeoni TaxID=291403 RepID=A0A327PJY9_9BACT|nr:response regulator [Algoriphagus yeomjeoni]RAI91564.1 CheY-like chemotaxis protein [Algoriphagus yeomjeoni]
MKNKHVFLIEDDKIFRLITLKMLNNLRLPYLSICECENGQIGLNELALKRDLDEEVIVFLDINMPVLSGWEFLEEMVLQKSFGLKNISIYIVSSSTDASDLNKSKSYEIVDGFIHKPLSLDSLKSIITTH